MNLLGLKISLDKMKITQAIFDELTAKAKASPRLRMNLDLRNSAEDQSQRMLNALEPGTVMPIHRHKGSSEVMVCLRENSEWSILMNLNGFAPIRLS